MKNIIRLIAICCLSFSFASNKPEIINLIFTNDLHGVIAEQEATFMNPEYPPTILGGSALYKYAEDMREECKQSGEGLLILDGGNFFQGNPLGIVDGGQFMIEWMNKMGYDALVPGRYDFILGARNLNELAEQSQFPFLASNIECQNCAITSENFKPYIIREINGIKIGILGIVGSAIEENVLSENKIGIRVNHEIETLNKWIPEIKDDGAEVVIVLASTGIPWNRERVYKEFREKLTEDWNPEEHPLNSLEMGYFADGVDVIISGGESKGYPLPWYDSKSHVYIFQNYGNGTEFGHIKLKIDPKSHVFVGYETVVKGRVSQTLLADDFTPDYEIHDWIKNQENKAIENIYNPKVAVDTKLKPMNNCNDDSNRISRDDWQIPEINLEDRIEIVTWNCEFFPTADDSTILALSEAVSDLNPDIIGFQEIRRTGWFSKLMDQLPQYDFVISQQSSFMDQAIIFRSGMFKLIGQVEPFAENDYNFAGRPPLQADLLYLCGEEIIPLSIIDLHMKCCDSGLKRRQKATKMLYNYLVDKYDNGEKNFIVLGDWNDDLKDKDNAHCFHPFFEDDRFYFVNRDIVFDIEQASYPKEPYVSFLDHILVTTELIPHSTDIDVRTLRMDEYMGGFDVYEQYISDHLPVLLSFPLK
ncbi:MAG: endonuclease/exonuclease/phosphatase family protein [Candidatus Marinimicrobia bacterium]|nr:endonuclease/exonuclease/phosphatase family protein [Candidatus Neomarinimicrobiota bacterium]MBL7023401.1 endonuclease/exonuclease/phosphatase family protein [Candidatus Neomarinimicrobiota bacterium]MBL7109782.1 endonuclease/exonuclease/phosphatase family protein [Candidatus Neomarinimicrobiota bacterium]